MEDILSTLKSLEARLDNIEKRLGIGTLPPRIPDEASKYRPKPQKPEEKIQASSGNVLGVVGVVGVVGVCCFIVAMILLIKFSIDSGWLTPTRQLLLAAVFGVTLIGLPFAISSKEKDYSSLLPSAGIVILHLTIYGGVYFHQILNPLMATGLIWGVGILSLFLLSKFKSDIYAILAIAGIYIGSILVESAFPHLTSVCFHLIIWDLIFVTYGFLLERRSLINITAYFALGVVCVFGIIQGTLTPELAKLLAIIEFVQILIIMLGTVVYSIRNKSPLKEADLFQLFPVFIFFYGLEYYYLDVIHPHLATGFSLTFSAILIGAYQYTVKKFQEKKLVSALPIFTLTTIMFYHTIYLVNLEDSSRIIFGLLTMLAIGLGYKKISTPPFRGVLILSAIVVAYSTLLVINGSSISLWEQILYSFAYGLFYFQAYRFGGHFMLILASHFIMVFGIIGLGTIIGEVWVGPLSVTYAFILLILAFKSQNKEMAKTTLLVVLFAILRFVFYYFDQLSALEQIGSLVLMGAIIYACGFVYRKIPERYLTAPLS